MIAKAKLFMHDCSQAARLPKEFRLPGKEMLVSEIGDKVIREPLPGEEPSFDVKAWRAKLDALGARDFLSESLPEEIPTAATAGRLDGGQTGDIYHW